MFWNRYGIQDCFIGRVCHALKAKILVDDKIIMTDLNAIVSAFKCIFPEVKINGVTIGLQLTDGPGKCIKDACFHFSILLKLPFIWHLIGKYTELPLTKIIDSLLQFCVRIHQKRAILSNRFQNRLSAQYQENTLFLCLYRDCGTFVFK
jgi:hypothetical protein